MVEVIVMPALGYGRKKGADEYQLLLTHEDEERGHGILYLRHHHENARWRAVSRPLQPHHAHRESREAGGQREPHILLEAYLREEKRVGAVTFYLCRLSGYCTPDKPYVTTQNQRRRKACK